MTSLIWDFYGCVDIQSLLYHMKEFFFGNPQLGCQNTCIRGRQMSSDGFRLFWPCPEDFERKKLGLDRMRFWTKSVFLLKGVKNED